ncbi:MAG: hypothetical protein ACR2LX_01650 [Jatrophihabitans sp.]
MTTKERLHQVVDAMPDERAADALALLESVAGPGPVSTGRKVIPSSLGFGASGRTDVSAHVDEDLAESFGR